MEVLNVFSKVILMKSIEKYTILDSDGRVYLPKEIRESLEINPKTLLHISIHENKIFLSKD